MYLRTYIMTMSIISYVFGPSSWCYKENLLRKIVLHLFGALCLVGEIGTAIRMAQNQHIIILC